MYYLYVIKSDVSDRIYIGVSADVATRVTQHNNKKVFSTRPYVSWRLIYTESFDSKTFALKRERQIKRSGAIRKLLKAEQYYGPIV